MLAPLSWLREYVQGVPPASGRQVAADLVRVGLEEEDLHGGDITGPLVVGRVLSLVDEPQRNGKTIRWCQVDVGHNGQRVTEGTPQGVVCGAVNFAVGDLVVVVLPGAVLPGGVHISARKTYGHISNGMICSAQELGIPSRAGRRRPWHRRAPVTARGAGGGQADPRRRRDRAAGPGRGGR